MSVTSEHKANAPSIHLDTSKLPAHFREAVEELRPSIKNGVLDFKNEAGSAPMTGWFDYPFRAGFERLKEVQSFVKNYPYIYDSIVIIGIGGSHWGAKAIFNSFAEKFDKKLFFCGHHLSSRQYTQLIAQLDGTQPLFFNVSLSGNTFETQVGSSLMWSYLKKRYQDTAKHRFFCIHGDSACNGLESSPGYQQLYSKQNIWEIEPNIGGRFSVPTEVAMLPLCFAGADFQKFLEGMQKLYNSLSFVRLDDPLIDYIATRHLASQSGKSIELLCFNLESHRSYVEWQRQLFAESQGKQKQGLLPVSLQLPSDLHSIGQWVQDGPPISLETFLEFEETCEITLPELESLTPFNKNTVDAISGSSLNSMNKKLFRSVYSAHAEQNWVIKLSSKQKGLESIGEMMAFMMVVNAVGANMMGVNPYDQPGVESYKRIFKEKVQNF